MGPPAVLTARGLFVLGLERTVGRDVGTPCSCRYYLLDVRAIRNDRARASRWRVARARGCERGSAGALILEPRIIDPGGSLDAYRAATELLLGQGVRHIVGCYTSSSRKEIIPSVEKFDGLLWYPSHYEGFESCPNVIYTGATANQHVVPLANWALPRYGGRVYCAGSNYIWAWESTRIMRDLVQAAAAPSYANAICLWGRRRRRLHDSRDRGAGARFRVQYADR